MLIGVGNLFVHIDASDDIDSRLAKSVREPYRATESGWNRTHGVIRGDCIHLFTENIICQGLILISFGFAVAHINPQSARSPRVSDPKPWSFRSVGIIQLGNAAVMRNATHSAKCRLLDANSQVKA